jgi:hypothetical protein
MSDYAQLRNVEMICQTLDVALVVDLADFEEIGISLFPLAPLNCMLLVFWTLVLGDDLAVSLIDQVVTVPQGLLDLFGGRILQVAKDRVLRGCSQTIIC